MFPVGSLDCLLPLVPGIFLLNSNGFHGDCQVLVKCMKPKRIIYNCKKVVITKLASCKG
jgi:hypothetical protein